MPSTTGSLTDLSRRRDADDAAKVPAPRRHWRTRIGLPAAIILFALALIAYAGRDALLPSTAVHVVQAVGKPVAVDETLVSASSTSQSTAASNGQVVTQAPGWLEPDPFPIHITALTEGIVREMLLLEGDEVKPQQVVAKLVDEDAILARQRAEAEVARKQAALDAAQSQWDHPVALKRAVAVNQAMLDEAHAQLAEIDALVAVESAKLAEAQRFYDRIKPLADGTVAESEVEDAALRLKTQQATLSAVKSRRAVADAKASQAAADIHAAKEDLELRIIDKQAVADAIASLAQAQAALDEAKLRESRMQVRSPAAGVVMMRYAAPGTRLMLAGNDPQSAYVADLYDPHKLQVRADIPLGEAARIGVGQPAQIIVDVLPDRVFTGHITRLVHQADIGKNTIQVKVAVDNPTKELKPEMLARVKFLALNKTDKADSKQDSPQTQTVTSLHAFVPESVIVQHEGKPAIWRVDPKTNTASLQTITLTTTKQDGWIAIATGINPGDAIIIDAKDLRHGQRVRVIENN